MPTQTRTESTRSQEAMSQQESPLVSDLLAQRFPVAGMDCPACAKTIESGVVRLDGVEQCEVDYGQAELVVQGNVDPEILAKRVSNLGFQLTIDGTESETDVGGDQEGETKLFSFLLSHPEARLALFATPLILPGLIGEEILGQDWPWAATLAGLAAILAGAPVLKRAYRAIRYARKVDFHVLMFIAALGALIIGAWTEAGMLMVLFGIGEALEAYSARRARDAVRGLMQLAPSEALRLRSSSSDSALPAAEPAGLISLDEIGISSSSVIPLTILESVPAADLNTLQSPDETTSCCTPDPADDSSDKTGACCKTTSSTPTGETWESVSVSDLLVGDRILVRPGMRVPADARIIEGASSLDESSVSGESLPVDKVLGDLILAGTVNGDGALEALVERPAGDSTIQRIAKMVEAAESQRAPTERFVDRFSAVYTPFVGIVALLTASIPPLLFDAPFLATADHNGWLYRALALLVVACPCALVIGTPAALISAVAGGARRGVLFRGSVVVEQLSKVQVLAFDKTGTLTRGQPSVVAARALDCRDPESGESRPHGFEVTCEACDDLFALVGAVEERSEHPMAHALRQEAERRGVAARYKASGVRALQGVGVTGTVEDQDVLVASHRHFDAGIAHPPEDCQAAEADADQGRTALMVSADDRYQGRISVEDELREESSSVIARLRDQGMSRLLMLTGDQRVAGERVARAVGIELADLNAGLLPADKLQIIETLQENLGGVAMVGDGINDTPALAAADVGIAVADNKTTAQALEVADLTLAGGSLDRLPYAIDLSRRAMQAVRRNAALAIGIKLAFLITLMAGFGTMWMAVIADVGTTVLVTLLGMRLLNFEGKDSVGPSPV